MTKDEACARLSAAATMDFAELHDIFVTCGWQWKEPSHGTKVYFHPVYEDCGMFPARAWLGELSPQQIKIVEGMVTRAILKEQLGHTT